MSPGLAMHCVALGKSSPCSWPQFIPLRSVLDADILELVEANNVLACVSECQRGFPSNSCLTVGIESRGESGLF